MKGVFVNRGYSTNSKFYSVTDPALCGSRSPLNGNGPVFVSPIAKKIAHFAEMQVVPQQSDYLAIWKSHEVERGKPAGKQWLGSLRARINPWLPYWLIGLKNRLLGLFKREKSSFSNQRHYRPVNIPKI